MRIVADASALAALIFDEADANAIRPKLDGATICAPELLKYELANTALKKARKHPKAAPEMFARLAEFFDRSHRIRWYDVDPVDVAVLAKVSGLSVYDAAYLWLAGWLEADLVTLDRRLSAATGHTSESPDEDAR